MLISNFYTQCEPGSVASLAVLARLRPFVGGVAGLLLITTGSSVNAAQVMSPSATPVSANLESHATLPENSEGGAWPQLRHLITTLERLSTPIDPDDLAVLLGLHKTNFDKSKSVRPLGKSPDGRSVFRNIQYENIPDNTNNIGVSLSVTQQFDGVYKNLLISESILFDAWPLNDAGPCISFSSIIPDIEKLKWDGRPPGFYRGVDGINMPDHDEIYLSGSNMDDILITIFLTKENSCITHIHGNIKNWVAQNHAG